MAALPIITVTPTGNLENQQFLSAGGDYIPGNTGYEIFDLKNNTGGLQKTLTVHYGPNATVDGQALTNHTLTIAPNTSYTIGPFPPELYNDANGNVQFTYSSATQLSGCVFRLLPLESQSTR